MDTPSGHGEASAGSAAPAAAGGIGAQDRPFGSGSPNGQSAGASEAGPDALKRLMADVTALGAQVGLLFSARTDQVKLSLRRALVLCLLAAVAVVGILALAASAVVLLVVGLAGGVAHFVGGPPWVGQLLTAIGLLGGGAGLGWVALRLWRRRSLHNTLKRDAKLDN